MDPRLNVIDERLKQVERIIAVSGGKGGIGKSSFASVLALNLSQDYKVGLLDLDFTSPSIHIILGASETPKENKGIVPPEVRGIKFMTVAFYTGEKPTPLRGEDMTNAFIELLAVTQWGPLNFLIIDTPPGISDVTLDIIRLVKKAEFLLVTTRSKLSLETVRKELNLLKQMNVPVLGIVENMKTKPSNLGLPIVGEIEFDKKFEDAIGTDKLLETNFAKDVRKIVPKIFN